MHLRHVQDLTAFGKAAWDSAEVLPALATHLGTVPHYLIWRLDHRERVPRMSRLTSRTLATRTTRMAWQTPQLIRRGRFTAGSTVFGQSLLEFLDASMGHLLFQRGQVRYQRYQQATFVT